MRSGHVALAVSLRAAVRNTEASLCRGVRRGGHIDRAFPGTCRDAKRVPGSEADPRWEIYVHGGRTPTGKDAVEWAREAVRLGAGELLVTSMDTDGHQEGYDLELLREFCAAYADDDYRATAEALGALACLPPNATLAQFLEQTHISFAQLGWKRHTLELASAVDDCSQRLDAKFPRALFLRWLEETARL